MRKILAVVLLLTCATIAFGQTAYHPPSVYVKTGLTVNWTAGTVNNGGHVVSVAAQTIGQALTANKNNCAAPAYSACDMIYIDSGGTGHFTTDILAASATGNTIIAFIETGASTITSIVYPWQNGQTFSATTVQAKSCGTTTTCAQTPILAQLIYGQCTASAATTCVVSGLTFTSATSYACNVTDNTTAANNALKITQAATSLTITTSSSSDTFSYTCMGT